MKKIINVSELERAVYEHNNPKFELTDDDIDKINEMIIVGFANELKIHPDAKKFRICDWVDVDGFSVFNNMSEYVFGTCGKGFALKDTVNKLLDEAGFYTETRVNKGLYVCIKK